jgi:chromosome segregation ATPase
MARAIVTEDAVAEVAQQLVEAGEEPSIIRVQAVIGGGSFSTVKRALDAWKAERQVAAAAPVAAPPQIVQRAAEFGRLLWQEAASLAAQEVNRVREEARRQVEQARVAEAEAEQAIARLEAEVEAQIQQLVEAQRERAEVRAALEQAQVAAQVNAARFEAQAERVTDLQRQVEAQAGELALARADLVAQARLVGEVEALRHQIVERPAAPALPAPAKPVARRKATEGGG